MNTSTPNSVPTLESLATQKTVLLTTFKKDGTPVGTPVNVVVQDGHAFFRTYDKAWKARRLRNNPEVEVAHSTYKGKVTSAARKGTTRLLNDAEAKPVRRLLARKHPVQQGVMVPLVHKLKGYKTLHYELILDEQ
ncbi:PPOX class F420-dependent oxidoreductase [Actinomadura barringtoniae]|uniref:PPOX class F420-dependent oxidoreductase n=1 Tax=Actinomadura barringtoniae TaxID=1427535 RepID=A0A939PET0_9ACTN|nr:PPOX class F420-dependent oxidoreductase [Actinomadura barringtoniae]MBO2448803.1 PPOX class F420-dependent oxidoreductase [Actinomadura barringtoniae]